MAVEELSIYLYKLMKVLIISLIGLTIYYLINIGNNYVDKDKKLDISMKFVIPVIVGLFLAYMVHKLFKKYGILPDMLYTIIFSIILAYLLNPIVKFFERKGIDNRKIAVLIIYLIIIGIIAVFAFLIVPKSGKEIRQLANNMPAYMNYIYEYIDKVIYKYQELIGDIPFIDSNLKASIDKSISGMEDVFINGLKSFFNTIVGMFSKVVALVLTPILTFYFLVDKEKFINGFFNLIPEKHKNDSHKLCKEIDNSLSQFVRGRMLMAVYVGVCITLVLVVLGVDFAIPIGFLTGFADIIPYIGPFIGFIPAVFFALLISPIKALWVSILFLIIQWTENNLLAPKVIGKTTGLHPLVVLLAIVIGGGMFGVLGMIFSVPVIAVAVIIYKFVKGKIKNKPENFDN